MTGLIIYQPFRDKLFCFVGHPQICTLRGAGLFRQIVSDGIKLDFIRSGGQNTALPGKKRRVSNP